MLEVPEEARGVRPQHDTLNNTNQVAEYTYNGAGHRIKKVTQTETRIFHYDLRGHLISETNQRK
jgi:YD repeat-containing protein